MEGRQLIMVHGLVQGVGFRPFVHRLAVECGLRGCVKNQRGAVLIEVQGDQHTLEQFAHRLRHEAPPLARIESIERRSLPVVAVESGEPQGFRIEPSEACQPVDQDGADVPLITADVATCEDCLAEMYNPADRRYRYPFINCTNCGPRLTVIQGAPYDRDRTTMARFAMCPACRAEYEDPSDRRFHAQAIACPTCGPQLELWPRRDQQAASTDPLVEFARAIRQGQIGALKGLGGFHLVCDAANAQAVQNLRQRKHRDEKPLAIMVASLEAAEAICELDEAQRQLLQSPRRPIVLLRKRRGISQDAPRIAEAVAPGNPYLGVMLPYTPLHTLLMEAVDGIPLVMTSGNRSDEPIAYDNQDAVERLDGVADVLLLHDRPIYVRCDDSVYSVLDGDPLPIRRSRGYAPEPIKLPWECAEPLLAVGGQLKNVFALSSGRQAFLSHHLGDLDHYEAYRAFERDIALYEQLFEIRPKLIVHDLHPDYASTRYSQRRCAAEGLERLAVQHHHAHVASCMAEHGLDEPVIGVAMDGAGYGDDGAIWGGEFLIADHAGYRRAAHLRYVRLPGGDQAARQPWRMAVSHLLDAGCEGVALPGVTAQARKTIEQMTVRGVQAPWTSSAGRLFDAVAALVGLRTENRYEGQAAMELEWLAADLAEEGEYPFKMQSDQSPMVIDTRPLIRAVVRDTQSGIRADVIARRFHATVAAMVYEVCLRLREATHIDAVVLSGGVFLNALLTRETCARLRWAGFRVYRHQQVPAGDGGLCLGQLAVAVRRLEAARTELSPARGDISCA